MDNQIEQEICGNCKKEIPQHNYVMHTAHCARNITLCQVCKEPISKSLFEEHKKSCVPVKPKIKKPEPPPTNIERSQYFQQRKAVEDKKIAARKERQVEKYDRLVDTGYSLKSASVTRPTLGGSNSTNSITGSSLTNGGSVNNNNTQQKSSLNDLPPSFYSSSASSKMLACKFCDLELPKLELEEHENYCGSRTDKCLECGELVMFKYKQIHMDSNHGFLKLKDEPGPRPSWDSTTQRSSLSTPDGESTPRRRPSPFRPFVDYDPTPYLPSVYSNPAAAQPKEKGESYKEISRRLDCKTEYIRNLLHDSASITVPLRHNGAVPRNHFNHNKGPAPQPPRRRRNPPTELTIPCEFCQTPIPHEELIQHETGCRPDLARFNPRRRSPEEDDYFVAPQPSSPEVELPCEFCAEMIPSSQLLRHQSACN